MNRYNTSQAFSTPAGWDSLPATTGFRTLRAGRMSYRSALALQEQLLAQRPTWEHDLLILLEHEPVITAGRGTNWQHLLASPEQLAGQGIDFLEVSRGGDLTYHGPGQLTGYPLVNLAPRHRDLHRYLRQLEAVLLRSLAGFGIHGHRREGQTGIWVGSCKIASIGIAVRRWITWHGFSLNVVNNLDGFANIIPCGLQNVRMTSMEECLQQTVDRDTVNECIIDAFTKVFAMPHLGEFSEN